MAYKELGPKEFQFGSVERCFFCGEYIRSKEDYVFWTGFPPMAADNGLIYLHPLCSKTLGQHLIKDGFCADGKQYRWPKRKPR